VKPRAAPNRGAALKAIPQARKGAGRKENEKK